ncbi:unnamed protein product [Rhizophagus irregularis]|nr:unnamed protein product [Rhizophagus irregularis]
MKDVVEMLFESTLMRVCDAIDMLGKVELALGFDERLMDGYLRAMQFDNGSASHQQVWSGLQRFLNEECDPNIKKRMERVFAEQKLVMNLDLTKSSLGYCYHENSKNIEQKKPQVWPMYVNSWMMFTVVVSLILISIGTLSIINI